MAVTKSQKEAILELLRTDAASQPSVVLLTTHNTKENLNSSLNFTLRSELMKKGIRIKVVKNTLIKKVFDTIPNLVGPSYVAYVNSSIDSDEVYTPKHVVEILKKDFEDYVDIIGSVSNGVFLDKKTTLQLSKTPSLQESLTSIAGLLNQCATQLALTIKEVPTRVARGINNASPNLS